MSYLERIHKKSLDLGMEKISISTPDEHILNLYRASGHAQQEHPEHMRHWILELLRVHCKSASRPLFEKKIDPHKRAKQLGRAFYCPLPRDN